MPSTSRRRCPLLPNLLLVLAGAALALSLLLAFAAARAQALGRRAMPACFRATPGRRHEGEPLDLAFLGDLQGGVVSVPGGLARALAQRPADLLVSSGDLVSHGEAPFYGLVASAFERAGIETPTRVVPGNHDLFPSRCHDDRIGGPLFERAFGPRAWHLDLGPALVIGIDTGTSWLLPDHLPRIAARLAEHPGKPWILVTHRPPWNLDRGPRDSYLDTGGFHAFLTEHKPALVVAGHLHRMHDVEVDGVRYVVNALGGDARGLRVLWSPAYLLRVRLEPARSPGTTPDLEIRFEPIARRLSLRSVIERMHVRLWEARRRQPFTALAWPVRVVLRGLGGDVPIDRHPHQRQDPSREELLRRRAEAGDAA